MMRAAQVKMVSALNGPDELGHVTEGRRPACFPVHAQFAFACDPVKVGTRESIDELHRHCPDCGRCYDCTDRSFEAAPLPFDRRASANLRVM